MACSASSPSHPPYSVQGRVIWPATRHAPYRAPGPPEAGAPAAPCHAGASWACRRAWRCRCRRRHRCWPPCPPACGPSWCPADGWCSARLPAPSPLPPHRAPASGPAVAGAPAAPAALLLLLPAWQSWWLPRRCCSRWPQPRTQHSPFRWAAGDGEGRRCGRSAGPAKRHACHPAQRPSKAAHGSVPHLAQTGSAHRRARQGPAQHQGNSCASSSRDNALQEAAAAGQVGGVVRAAGGQFARPESKPAAATTSAQPRGPWCEPDSNPSSPCCLPGDRSLRSTPGRQRELCPPRERPINASRARQACRGRAERRRSKLAAAAGRPPRACVPRSALRAHLCQRGEGCVPQHPIMRLYTLRLPRRSAHSSGSRWPGSCPFQSATGGADGKGGSPVGRWRQGAACARRSPRQRVAGEVDQQDTATIDAEGSLIRRHVGGAGLVGADAGTCSA